MSEEKQTSPMKDSQKFLRLTRLLAWSVTTMVTLGFIFWLYRPVFKYYLMPEPTPTLVIPTPTLVPTQTPTLAPMPTQAPVLTPTLAVSLSKFFVQDLTTVYPEMPDAFGSGYVIDDKDVIANPDISDIVWSSSDTISSQIGYQAVEPFIATFAAGEATWKMDIPLAPGIYDIYVMDTLISSGGSLDFRVLNNDMEIYPYLGMQHVDFYTMRGESPQYNDVWRSIGAYNLESEGILSVTTSWEKRNEYSVVAIDRVMIIPRPAATYMLLSKLPLGRTIFLLDDPDSVIENAGTSVQVNKGPVWNDSAELIVNPEDATRVTWKTLDPIPVGKYEIWAWIPELTGTAKGQYSFKINEDKAKIVEGTDPGPIMHGGRIGGQWVSIGQVDIGLYYSPKASLSIIMEPVSGATIGELGVDAIAIIKQD